MSKFEYPRLSRGEIITVLLENHFAAITESDLKNPKPDFFLDLYARLLMHLDVLHDQEDAKMNLIRPIAEELMVLDEQQREWEAKISQLNTEIDEHNAVAEKELPVVQEVDSKVKDLHRTIATLNSQQMSLKSSFRKLKEKSGEIDGEISRAEFDLVQSAQENANLRSKIVQSPDKLLKALEEKKSIRDEAKSAQRAAMEAFQEKTDILELYTKTFKKMSKYMSQMQGIHEQVNSAKSIEKDYKTLKAKLSDDQILDKSLDAKLAERQGKVNQLDELRKLLEKERDIKWEEGTKNVNNIKLEVESKRNELEERKRKLEAKLMEVDVISSKISLIEESEAAQVTQLVHKCEQIVEYFQEYTKSIEIQFGS